MADRPQFSIRWLLAAVAIMAIFFATLGQAIRSDARRRADAERQLKADVAAGIATVYPDGTVIYFRPERLRPN